MNIIESLSGNTNASGVFNETYGVVTPVVVEHADHPGWFIHVTLGYGGLKFKHSTTQIALTLTDLLTLAKSKEPNLKPQLSTPTAAPDGGSTPALVTLACADAGASIYYTTDGSDPDAGDTLYSAPFNVATACILKAVAIKSDWRDSAIKSASFT